MNQYQLVGKILHLHPETVTDLYPDQPKHWKKKLHPDFQHKRMIQHTSKFKIVGNSLTYSASIGRNKKNFTCDGSHNTVLEHVHLCLGFLNQWICPP